MTEGGRLGTQPGLGPRPGRILYLLRYYPTLSETFVYREIREIMERGWDVSLATFGGRSDGVLQDEAPGLVPMLPPGRPRYLRILFGLLPLVLRGGCWRALFWLASRFRTKDALKALWLVRNAGAFDLVHAHFAGEAAEWAHAAFLLWGTPYTVTVHATDLFRPRPSLSTVLRAAAAAVTISAFNAELIALRTGVSAQVVRCGVPSWRYPQVDPGRQPLVVAAIGRWVPKKGFDLLLQAVARCASPVELLLVSDAPQSLASDRVRCLGLRPPSEISSILARSGLVALPAREADDGDMDGVPVVLMEALAAGVPVLTTNVSGIPELVDDEVGWVVPPGDLAALVSALDEAAAGPEERRLRGARGPERLKARACLLSSQAEGMEAIWKEILGSSPLSEA